MGIARAIPAVRRAEAERDAARAELQRTRSRLRRTRARLARREEEVELRRKWVTSTELAVQHLRDELEVFRTVDPPAAAAYEYVFVMAFQRSGSTLLQVILNSIPGYLIRGENAGVLAHQYRFHRTAQQQKRVRGDWANQPGFPFFGINDYPDAAATAGIRDLVTTTLLRPLPDSRVLGFKEVAWHVEDLDDYVDFFREVFPGARFIANTRRIEDAAKSRWWGKRDDAVDVLTAQQERILAATERLGDRAFHLHYDDYVNDTERLRPLFDWLGAPFDREAVDRLMETEYA